MTRLKLFHLKKKVGNAYLKEIMNMVGLELEDLTSSFVFVFLADSGTI